MFGRDPRIPLTELLTPRIHYLGTDENILSLEAMTEIYHMVAQNLKLARERRDRKVKIKPPTYTVGDLVLLHNHTGKSLEPRFKDYFRVLVIKGNQIQLMPIHGKETQWAHISDVKYVLPVDAIIDHLTTKSISKRPSTLNIHPARKPDLQWQLATTLNTIHSSTTNTTTTAYTSLSQDYIVTVLTVSSSIIPI